MHKIVGVLMGTGLLLVAFGVSANDYDDVASDLSNAFGSPTPVPLSFGANVIRGTTGTQNGLDRDYFRITVPAGAKLTSLDLVAFDGTRSFIGVETGTVFTDPNTTAQSNLLGWVHFTPSLVGTNILDDMAAGAGAQGFTGPLPAGDYSFWIQENGTPLVSYTLRLTLAAATPAVPALPAPFGTLLLVGLGLGGLALAAHRRDSEGVLG
jgi:hypothetical protein